MPASETFTINSKSRLYGGMYRLYGSTASGAAVQIYVGNVAGQSVYERYDSRSISLYVPDLGQFLCLYNEPLSYQMKVDYILDPPIYDPPPVGDGMATYAVVSVEYGQNLEHPICLMDLMAAGVRAQTEILRVHTELSTVKTQIGEVIRRLPRIPGHVASNEDPSE